MSSLLSMPMMAEDHRSVTSPRAILSPRRAGALCALALASMLTACDSQAGDDYQGEPLAELGGTITVAEGTAAPSDADATLVWHVWSEGDSASVTDKVTVDGDFPASFELSLFTPPPEHAWFDLGDEDEAFAGAHIATGYVMLLPPDDVGDDMQQIFDAALGVANGYLLVWSDGTVPESFNNGLFQGGLEAGYQLFKATPSDNTAANACWDEVYACEDACYAQPPESLSECISACPTGDACPAVHSDETLVPVPMDSDLAIVIGGEKHEPDWF